MPAAGLYATQADVENTVGVDTVAQWSNPGGWSPGVVANQAVLQLAFNKADGDIVACFRLYGNFSTPLNPQNFAINLVNNWSIALVIKYLFQATGLRDTTSYEKWSPFWLPAEAEMAQYRWGGGDRLDASQRWPQPTCPTSG